MIETYEDYNNTGYKLLISYTKIELKDDTLQYKVLIINIFLTLLKIEIIVNFEFLLKFLRSFVLSYSQQGFQ